MPIVPVRRIPLTLLALSLAAVPAATLAPAAGAATSAGLSQTVQQAVTSLQHATSARVFISTEVKGQRSTETIDSANGRGTATATEDGKVLHILYNNGTIYLQAKPAVLVSVLGMPASLASRYGGKWLSAPTSVSSIAQLAQLFSLGTYAKSLIALASPLSQGSETSAGGHAVVAVKGKIPKTPFSSGSGAGDQATVVVAKSAPHYPVSVTFSDKTSGTTSLTFGHWGEKIAAAPPAGSTPLSSLAGSSSSSSSSSSG